MLQTNGFTALVSRTPFSLRQVACNIFILACLISSCHICCAHIHEGLVSVSWWDKWLWVYNTDNWFSFSVTVEQSDRFGCHFATQVNSPGTHFPNETMFGLLGTCNYDSSDDWRDTSGNVLTPPATPEEALFSTSYEYCTDNWCVHDETKSIFTYGAGESFE